MENYQTSFNRSRNFLYGISKSLNFFPCDILNSGEKSRTERQLKLTEASCAASNIIFTEVEFYDSKVEI